jgi:toxin ParE1/3/4
VAERFTLVWSRTAQDDLQSILEYVATQDGADRAIALYDTLRWHIDRLIRFPRRARVVPELKPVGLTEFRELLIAPYRVFFRLDGPRIVLLGVLDGRRDLGEWLIERALRFTEGS